jgi:hypothetical protein
MTRGLIYLFPTPAQLISIRVKNTQAMQTYLFYFCLTKILEYKRRGILTFTTTQAIPSLHCNKAIYSRPLLGESALSMQCLKIGCLGSIDTSYSLVL